MPSAVLEDELRKAAAAVERECRRAVVSVNERVIPAVRAESVRARRQGARLLRTWADRLDAPQTSTWGGKR